MTDETRQPPPAAERQARLAKALRENLKRRKHQARARAGEEAGPAPPERDKDRQGER